MGIEDCFVTIWVRMDAQKRMIYFGLFDFVLEILEKSLGTLT